MLRLIKVFCNTRIHKILGFFVGLWCCLDVYPAEDIESGLVKPFPYAMLPDFTSPVFREDIGELDSEYIMTAVDQTLGRVVGFDRVFFW